MEEFVLGLQNGIPLSANQEVLLSDARTEGGQKVYVSVRYERDPELRERALAIHGYACMACDFDFDFDFELTYGPLGEGFAEVHHMIPLADAGTRKTDPHTDLAVLCANCHRMVHRKRGICLSLGELKQRICSL